jgi:hypothetical protein
MTVEFAEISEVNWMPSEPRVESSVPWEFKAYMTQ